MFELMVVENLMFGVLFNCFGVFDEKMLIVCVLCEFEWLGEKFDLV